MNTNNKTNSYRKGKIMWVDYSHGTIDAKDSNGQYFTATWEGCKELYVGDHWYFSKDSSHPDAEYRAVKKFRSRSLKSKAWHLKIVNAKGRVLFKGDMDEHDKILDVMSEHNHEYLAIGWLRPELHKDDAAGPWAYAGFLGFDDASYRDMRGYVY